MMISFNETTDSPIYTIAKCLNEIIVNNDLDNALQKIVDWLTESLEIDCCYIFENGIKSKGETIFASNSTDNEERVIINTRLFPEIHQVLCNNRCFKVSINNKVSRDLYDWLKNSGLQSLLLIPVFRGSKFWGSIGFGDTKNSRTWHNSEIQLQSLASAIGSAKETEHIKNQIHSGKGNINSPLPAINQIEWEVDLVHNTSTLLGSTTFINCILNENANKNILVGFYYCLHKDDVKRVSIKFKNFLKDKLAFTEEDVYRIFNKQTGKYVWMHSRYTIRRDSNGNGIFLSGTSVDISESKEVGFELSRQRDQYRFLVQSLGQVVFSLDKNAKCSFLSPAWYDLTGHNPSNCFGNTFLQYLNDDHVHIFWEELNNLLSEKKNSFDRQLKLVTAAGEKIWVRILAKATYDLNNTIDGFFGTIENINRKYNEQLLLHESSERINAILNNSKEIILTINLENQVIENVNEAISILDYQPEEWINKSLKTWKLDQRRKFNELIKLGVQSELKVQNQQISFPNKSNTQSIPFEISTSLYYYKNNKYLLCVLRDMRERIKYEESIQRISKQLTHLLNNIDDVYAIFDLKSHTYDFVSDNVEGLYGCDKSAYCDNTSFWRNCINKEDVAGVENEVQEIIQKKSRGEIFYRIVTCTGERRMILEKLVVGKDSLGNAEKLYIVKTDYTNIENAEQSLMETERKFRFISENLSDFISIHDPDWNFTYASPSIKNILGFEPAEILGLGGLDLVHPDDLLKTLNDSLQPIVISKKETRFRYRMLSKDGNYKWVENYSKPVIDSKNEISSIISSTRDVTDQVIAENKLRESEEQYRLLSENSNDVIGIHNLRYEYIYVSPSCKQVLGYDQKELLGLNPKDVFIKEKKDFTQIKEFLKERKFVTQVVTKNGEEKLLEVWLKPVFKDEEVIALQSASRDVTEREKLLGELEASLAKERELNELRAKFVSTASHQFRTPLTVIQSGVEIMDMYLEDLPNDKQVKFQRQFKKIQEEVSRLEYLMNDVLLLGRANAARTPFRPEVDNLTTFCNSILVDKFNNLHPSCRQTILTVSGKEVPVSFDSKLLGHAIENIINNAYKYSETGPIRLNLIYNKKQVIIKIEDQGIGIPEEDVKNLFEPFYRATNTSEIEGTGLGLSIVKEFVEKHKGKIFLSSKLNKGTCVSVILPIA